MLRSVACPRCKYPNAAGVPVCENCKTSLLPERANPASQTTRRPLKPEPASTRAGGITPGVPTPRPGAGHATPRPGSGPPATPLGTVRPAGMTPPSAPRADLRTTDLARPLPSIAGGDQDIGFDDEITDIVRPLPPPTTKGEKTQRVSRDAVLEQAGLRPATPAPARPIPPRPAPPEPALDDEPALERDDLDGPLGWICSPPLASLPVGPGSLLTIGRQPGCDFFLAHPQVSRVHARIIARGEEVVIEDAGSANGILVNGKNVSGARLQPDDLITIGPFEVAFRLVPPEEGTQQVELPTSRSLAPVGDVGFAGKIGGQGLAEVLQQIEFNEKTGTLYVEDGKLRGKLLVATGRPMSAGWHGDFDEDAVLSMLKLRSGTYRFTGDLEAGEPTMRSTITRLLLDASREQDEGVRPAGDAL